VLTNAEPAASTVDLTARFDALFERLYPGLFGLTYRVLGDQLEAEDVLQEAFLRLTDAPILARPDDEVAAWLRRVCLNFSANRRRDAYRARQRLERVGRLDLADASATSSGPAAEAERREAQAEVRRALACLPERQRDCLLLRHSGYSYTEIAATLEVAVGSVGVLLARAERAFRAAYEERRHDDLS